MTEKLNNFQIISSCLCFLAEEVILKTCYFIYDHDFYLTSVNDIAKNRANLNRIKLKFLIKFQYILFYTLLSIFLYLYKKLRGVNAD